ncbi:MAG: hypothetical protein K2X27_08140 [Candidatus Obscuribacterales bacterium]|nr:hypothetical protein [Candidatus Obscuribacterales bacterium]
MGQEKELLSDEDAETAISTFRENVELSSALKLLEDYLHGSPSKNRQNDSRQITEALSNEAYIQDSEAAVASKEKPSAVDEIPDDEGNNLELKAEAKASAEEDVSKEEREQFLNRILDEAKPAEAKMILPIAPQAELESAEETEIRKAIASNISRYSYRIDGKDIAFNPYSAADRKLAAELDAANKR